MRKQDLHPCTAIVNQKQKNLSKKARLQALAWLTETFPHAFDNRLRMSPLSVGIMDDILVYADEAAKAGISKSKLREAVVLFTRRIDYLTCLKAREMRVDLQGQAVSQVTESEAAVASAKIKKRVEKNAKSARKILNSQSNVRVEQSRFSNASLPAPSATEYSPYFPERPPAFSVENSIAPTSSITSVRVTHKQTRQYDPAAVARLKEKLNLSRRKETEAAT